MRTDHGCSVLRSSHEGEICSLVPLDFEHTNEVVEWRNDPYIAAWFLTQHRFDKAGHESWLARTHSTNTDFNWVIRESSGCLIGMVGIYNVEWEYKRAEFGRLLIGSQQARGKGMAREATKLALNAAKIGGLNEIYLVVKSSNISAYSIYSSVGFIQERVENELTTMRIVL
ncbi:GNAT family N-acetyltransferase [Methylobacterium sp. M6A4_1b]